MSRSLPATLATLALLALGAAAPARADRFLRTYHSRPDLRPPKVFVTHKAARNNPGDVFLSPRPAPGALSGPMIIDGQGNLVYWHQLAKGRTAINVQPQDYRGQRVMTYIERPAITGANIYSGNSTDTYAVIMDERYHEVARVHAVGPGVVTDLHDFVLNRDGTALLLGFRVEKASLSSVGGTSHGTIVNNFIQIVDVKTNKLLFDWHANTHIPLSESYAPVAPSPIPYDYLHMNSVALDRDGNIVASARHTWAIYKISRSTGRIIWRLGGKRSTYRLGRGVKFHYQHDAQPQPDGTYTLFDNNGSDFDARGGESRSLRVRLSNRGGKKTATLSDEHRHSPRLLALSQGNMQLLPGGERFVGWGNSPFFTQYSKSGKVLLDGHIIFQRYQSYRAFHARWRGRPGGRPKVAASSRKGRLKTWSTWDGSSLVARWQILTSASASGLRLRRTVTKSEFEQEISLRTSDRYVQARALDSRGGVLGSSAVLRVK